MTIHETDIGRIELTRVGEGSDTVLLLHAAASGPRALYKLGAALSAPGAGWQAALLGLNGYGGTVLADARADDPFAAHGRALSWAFDAIGRDKPGGRRVIFGHSMGGLIALTAVLETLRPDALILYEPIVLGHLDLADPQDRAAHAWDAARVDRLRAGVETGDPEAGVRSFIEAFNEVSWETLPAPLRAELVAKAPQLSAETRQAPHIVLDRAKLANLGMPVLILQGSTSPTVTHRMTQRLAEAIPHAERILVASAGHMGPALSAGAVHQTVQPFLSAIAARSRL